MSALDTKHIGLMDGGSPIQKMGFIFDNNKFYWIFMIINYRTNDSFKLQTGGEYPLHGQEG